MPNNINILIPKESYKRVEEVREIKYEVPTYEEFMKTSWSDERLNYDDLNGGSIGEVKGYGPCVKCGNSNLDFKLEIVLKNFTGGSKSMTVYNVDNAREEAAKIIKETGHWNDDFWGTGTFSTEKRRRLANRINDAIDEHINENRNINKVVDSDEDSNDDKHGPSLVCNQS